jgi:hypothetical protein
LQDWNIILRTRSARAWTFALLVLAGLIPLVWPAIPPLTDLPAHMGRYRVELDLDTSASLQRYFGFQWRMIGNLGVDLLMVPLGRLLGLEPAAKLIVMGIVAATMVSFLWISREIHGRVQLPAIAVLVLGYNYPLLYGFVNYSLAMAAALLGFALWLHLTRRGLLVTRTLVFCVVPLLVWTCHIIAWAVLGFLCFVSEAVRLREAGQTRGQALFHAVVACLPLAPAVIPSFFWQDGEGARTIWTVALGAKLKWIAFVQRDRWAPIDLMFAVALYGLLALRLIRPRFFRFDARLGLGAIGLVVIFFVTPVNTMMGSAYAGERLFPYAVALALLALRVEPLSDRYARLLAVGVALFFVARIAVVTASMAVYDREWRANLAALNHIEPGSAVASFVGKDCPGDPNGWFTPRLGHIPSMAIVRRDAFTNDQFAQSGAQLLQIHYPQAGAFQRDPSHQVARRPCAPDKKDAPPPLSEKLATLPRGAFDYVWVMYVKDADKLREPWLEPVWQGDEAGLYRIRR